MCSVLGFILQENSLIELGDLVELIQPFERTTFHQLLTEFNIKATQRQRLQVKRFL